MGFIHFLLKKSYISVLFFLLAIIQGCVYRVDRVTVEGQLIGNVQSYLYFSSFEDERLVLFDSVKTTSKGYFQLTLNVENCRFVTIGLDKAKSPIILLIQPGDYIRIQANDSSLSDYRVFGSSGSALVRSLTSSMKKTKQQIDSLRRVYNANLESIEVDSIRHELDSTFRLIIVNHRNYLYDFVKDNPFSPASILALFQSYDSLNPVFDYAKDRKLFRLVDSTLLSVYSSNSMVNAYHSRIQQLDSLYERSVKRDLMYKVGEVLPNVGYPLITGENLFINGIWFRYILVDFQGSWCERCKRNSSYLKEVYKEYAPKGLVVLQVTLGVTPDSLRASVLRDSLMWYNACVPDMYNSRLLDTLRVSSIPSNYIADRWGTIKATNLSGAKLRLKLSELLP